MKFSFYAACIFLMILFSCGPGKDQTASEDITAPDSAVNVSEDNFAEDTTTINDEDYGDPGLVIDPENLEPEVKTFLASLTRDALNNIVTTDQEVLLIEPGPGIHPIYSFINSSEDLLGVNELLLLLSDSSALLPSTFYRMVYDPCQILEEMPEGIYLQNNDFTDLSFSDYDNEDLNKKLQHFTEEIKSESGVELLIKFRTKTDDLSFLHLLTARRNGQLFLVIIDQRDCGA